MKKILIIGHFGENKEILDGQTIKTRILYDELKKATLWEIKTVDTYDKEKKPVRLLFRSILGLLTTRDVIVLLSGRGMRFYFPILYFFAKVFRNRIYHDLIGGNLDIYVKKYPKFKKYLQSFVVNWTETSYVKEAMKKMGLVNFELLPNFKRLNCVDSLELKICYYEPYKLCTFSRVLREKGIEDAINAIKEVNKRLNRTIFTLDIYGQVDSEQIGWFEQLKKDFPSFVKYGGEVPYGSSTGVLKKYFALLFPTQFYMEGIPGTIIDAYAAGVPVISSKWRSFDDVVFEGDTGIGYEFMQQKDLVNVLMDIANYPQKLTNMKKECLEVAKTYLPEKNIDLIVKKVECI